MPRMSPDARRALVAERRQQILQAAATVFAEKGFERATISDIARRAGIAEGSIYNYFKKKEDLLLGLPQQVIYPPVQAVLAQMTQSANGDAVPPRKILETIAYNFVTAARQNGNVFRILISAMPNLKQSTRQKYMDQVVMFAVGVLEKYFAMQIELGVFRKDLDARLLAFSFIGMFFPIVVFREIVQVQMGDELSYERSIQQAIPLFLRGVMADTAEGNFSERDST